MTCQPTRANLKLLLKRPMIPLVVAALFVFSLVGANIAGRKAARADIERLEKVWPFIDRLSEAPNLPRHDVQAEPLWEDAKRGCE